MDASFAFSKDSVADDFGEEMMAWIDKESTNQNPSFVWPRTFLLFILLEIKILLTKTIIPRVDFTDNATFGWKKWLKNPIIFRCCDFKKLPDHA